MATIQRSSTDKEWEVDKANHEWRDTNGNFKPKEVSRLFDLLVFKYELREGWKRSAIGCYPKYPELIVATRLAELTRLDKDYRAVDEMVSEALNNWNENTNRLTLQETQ